MTVTVDGRDNVPLSASYSGPVLTLRLETTQVLEGQEVKVAYNNIFAAEPGAALTDTVGNAVEPLDLPTVANASEDDNSIDYIDPQVLNQQTLTLCEGDDSGSLFTPLDMVLPSPEYVGFTQDNWDTNKTIRALTAVDDDRYTNWAMIYHRIDGVDEAETYESVIRILISQGSRADHVSSKPGVVDSLSTFSPMRSSGRFNLSSSIEGYVILEIPHLIPARIGAWTRLRRADFTSSRQTLHKPHAELWISSQPPYIRPVK